MEDPDYDEDLYEEKSKLVYRRRSSTSQHDLFNREPSSSRAESDEERLEQPFRGHSHSTPRSSHRSMVGQRLGRRASWSEMSRRTDPIRREMVERRSPSYERIEFSTDEPLDSEMDGTVEIRKVKKEWSYKRIHGRQDDQSSYGRSADQSSYGGRDDLSTRASTVKTEDKSKLTPTERHVYCPVTKWDVDYTNRNYVRSMCNKPIGLHRYTLGKQFKWDVDQDNSLYVRSQVNAPKGLHRRTKEIKRKRVPDNDVLGDATGWQFEYGPEFLQVEEDVPFMPDERAVGRGAYRYYGVERSQSDTDVKDEERRQQIPGLIEDEFKYGTEFLQDDVQHTLNQKDGTIGRGAYRFYGADRSPCDKKPCDMMGVDYRESRARIEQSDECHEEDKEGEQKGKPFKRTILKKTVKLLQRSSDEKVFGDKRYGAHLKFVPGMGSRAAYEATPTDEVDRKPDLQVTRHPSIRSIFKKKTNKSSRSGQSEGGFRCEKKYSHKHIWDGGQSGKSDYSVHPKEKIIEQGYGTSDRCGICDRNETIGKSYGSSDRCEICNGRETSGKKTGQSYGTSDRCELCDRKGTPGKIQKAPLEERYSRTMPTRRTRPPAQSVTSYESCNLCDRKEEPGMKTLDIDADDSCIICEKKKTPRKGKTRVSPSRFTRGIAYSSRGGCNEQEASGLSYASLDSCNLCEEEKEAPRVAAPKWIKESKPKKRSPTARKGISGQSYASLDSCVLCEEEEEVPRVAPPKWIKESKPKKRSPTARKGTSGRSYASLDSCNLCEEEEVPRVAPPKWIKETKPRKRSPTGATYAKKSSPSCHGCERGYGGTEIYEKRRKSSPREYRKPEGEKFRKWKEMEKRETCPLRMTGSISQRQPRNIRKEPRTTDYYQRFNSPYACPAEMMDDDDDVDIDEEMFDDIPSCIENRINKIKKRMSETCLPCESGKGRPKRLSASSPQKRDIQVPMEPKYKEWVGRYQDQCVYAGEAMNDLQDMSSEEFIPHVESSTQMVKKTVSRTSFPAQKKKISPKRINNARKGIKHKDCFKDHGDEDSRGIKEKGKIVDKFPPGSRSQTKKAPPTKLPNVRRKSLKEYREDGVDEFSDGTDEIDFEEHKNHPKDHGKSFKDGYEKYVNKNGSEIWVKTEEKYSELHHIP